MALTNRLLLAYNNLADSATLTAQNEVAALPVSNLKTLHLTDKWQATNATSYVQATVSGEVGAVCLFGMTYQSTIRFRVRVGSDATFATQTYDSGLLSSQLDANIGAFVHFLNTPITAPYVRISFDTAIATAGRLFIGPYLQFERNFDFGVEQSVTDLSRRTKSKGGQTYIDIGSVARTLRFTMPAIRRGTETDFIKALDRVVGLRGDVLACLNPLDLQQGRDSIFGLLTDIQPLTWRMLRFSSKTFSIEERL